MQNLLLKLLLLTVLSKTCEANVSPYGIIWNYHTPSKDECVKMWGKCGNIYPPCCKGMCSATDSIEGTIEGIGKVVLTAYECRPTAPEVEVRNHKLSMRVDSVERFYALAKHFMYF